MLPKWQRSQVEWSVLNQWSHCAWGCENQGTHQMPICSRLSEMEMNGFLRFQRAGLNSGWYPVHKQRSPRFHPGNVEFSSLLLLPVVAQSKIMKGLPILDILAKTCWHSSSISSRPGLSNLNNFQAKKCATGSHILPLNGPPQATFRAIAASSDLRRLEVAPADLGPGNMPKWPTPGVTDGNHRRREPFGAVPYVGWTDFGGVPNGSQMGKEKLPDSRIFLRQNLAGMSANESEACAVFENAVSLDFGVGTLTIFGSLSWLQRI